jgi:hypothetical protein
MAKQSDWNHPVQSNPDLGREKLTRDESARKYPQPRDISKKVDKNANQDDGFSGRLTSED